MCSIFVYHHGRPKPTPTILDTDFSLISIAKFGGGSIFEYFEP
jgi:hypothetical protein